MRVLLLVLFPATALAAPITLHHNTRVLDAEGQPVNGTVSVAVSLFTSDDGTGEVFRQDFGTQTVSGGFLSLALNTNTADGTPLDSGWMDRSLWIGTEINSSLQTPLQPLLEVPRAGAVDGPVRATTSDDRCIAADTTTHGWLRFDPTQQALLLCTAQGWSPVGQSAFIVETSGVRSWSDGSYAVSCEDYRRPTQAGSSYTGAVGDGIYAIDPDGDGNPREVSCDMTTDDGGWTSVIDFNRATQPCPSGLVNVDVGPVNGCSRNVTTTLGGAASGTFEVGFPWQEARVQGTLWARGSQDGFDQLSLNRGGGIDGLYVDGTGLTTVAPRTHVFTWAFGTNPAGANGCPAVGGAQPPSFVGADYRCQTYSGTGGWAGPYFASNEDIVTLPAPTSQDLEIRVMSNQESSNEDSAFSTLRAWVR